MSFEHALLLSVVAVSVASLYLSVTSLLKVKRVLSLVRSALASGRTRPVRPRKRYLVFEVVALSGELTNIKRGHLEEAIQRSCQLLFGVVGYGAARPSLVYYDELRGVGVLAFKHVWRNQVLLTLSLIKEVNGVRVTVVPLLTTGTRRKAMDAVRKS